MGRWCRVCEEDWCVPPPQPIADEPGDPIEPAPRGAYRWRNGRKVPPTDDPPE